MADATLTLFGEAPAPDYGDDLDFYETPVDAIDAIIPLLPWRDQHWALLDPGAGRGAIVWRLLHTMQPCCAAAIELHPGRFGELYNRVTPLAACVRADYLTLDIRREFPGLFRYPRLIALNPPYTKPRKTIGLEFVEKSLELASPDGCVAALLPLDFATGVERCDRIHDKYAGSVYPLRRRPYFGGPHQSGARPFAWFVWDLLEPKREWRVI